MFLIFLGFFGGIFLENFFWEEIFLGGFFCEDFLGGFFWEDFLRGFFGDEFLVYIVKVS